MSLLSKLEKVSPEKAEQWLGKAAPNRNVRQSQVARYAREMSEGKWHLTGESIKFNSDEMLIDGQHRLQAVVQAGVAVEMLVVRGLPDDAVMAMDSGIKRKLSDLLKMRGEINSVIVASSLLGILQTRRAIQDERWPYRGGIYPKGTGMGARNYYYPSNDEALTLLDAEPEIREVAPQVHGRMATSHTGLSVRPTSWITAYYLLSEIDEEDTDEFFQLPSGVGVQEGSGIYFFRRRFTIAGYDHPAGLRDQLAFLFKVWNYWRDDVNPGLLSWKPGGKHGEKFPVPH